MVEELVPRAREALTDLQAHELRDTLRRERPEIATNATDEQFLAVLKAGVAAALNSRFPMKQRLRPSKTASIRWESLLSYVGLQARPERPIPDDLDAALAEVIQLRHVIAHRASRVDTDALRWAPTLPYESDQLVRISRGDFRRYSAALRTYGDEVTRRLLGPSLVPDMPLEQWRHNYIVNS
jgi:hypothetical protein